MNRCGECGSWERECGSESPQTGCGCMRCAAATITTLYRIISQRNEMIDELQKQVSSLKGSIPK